MIRPYSSDSDFDHIIRIWKETGWIDPSEKRQKKAVKHFLESCSSWVVELNGAAECLGAGQQASFCYADQILKLHIVAAITTSHVSRKQGWASRITARVVSDGAEKGYDMAALGIFDQGFYNKLGFGNGPYEHYFKFNPTQLNVPNPTRPPIRLHRSDWERMHQALLKRPQRHGRVYIEPALSTRAELGFFDHGFGLGFTKPDSEELSHYLWMEARDTEANYFRLKLLCFNTYEQFGELLSLLKSLGDQVLTVNLKQPPGIQFQDVLKQPFRNLDLTRGSRFSSDVSMFAQAQMRMINLGRCIEAVQVEHPISFNLELEDPIEPYLPEDSTWRGIGGSYKVHLGPQSHLSHGYEPNLPTLKAGVGAFTRMWFGCLPASSLAFSDVLKGDAKLIAALDKAFAPLPVPHFDWDF